MVSINEWLPNPEGSDVVGEWVELWNSGDVPAAIGGWQIVADEKVKFTLPARTIGPGEYSIVPRSESKLVLKNTDGKLSLFNQEGRLVDSFAFVGSAPEEKSVTRLNYESENLFRFAEPTPGAPNETVAPVAAAIETVFPQDGRFINSLEHAEALWLIFFGALAVAGFVTYATKKHGYLSELFFGEH